MAFEGLSSRLQEITRKLKGKARITESDLKEMLREVKLALLEADVNYKIVKEFISSIQEKALGQDVMKSLTPGQQVIKIVKDEMIELLGGTESKINFTPNPPTVIMLVGLQGSGKTTTIAKIASHFKLEKETKVAFITSDIDIDQGLLREALRYATNKSFNRISVDGQTSTNDMAIVLANGKAGNKKVTEKDANYDIFLQALVYICTELAKLVARDGEGATKLIECVVEGAKTEETAARLSKAVITSTMVKAAIFGSDANWGRILCAIGCEGSEFDPNKIDIIFESRKGYIEVCKDGEPLKFNEKKARSILEDDEITIIVDLQMGDARANAWGCDLTYEYVRINGSYRS